MNYGLKHVCLFTDSLEPSGVGEHMVTLAAELQDRYRLSFVCPPSPGGSALTARARDMGFEALPWAVNLPGRRSAFTQWLVRERVCVFHGHAGIGWEGHDGVYAARQARVPVILRTEHLPYLITDPAQRRAHREMFDQVDCLLAVSEDARSSFAAAGLPVDKLRAIRNGIRLGASTAPAPVRQELGLDPQDAVVLTVGRFSEQKGHSYLLDAVPLILRRHSNAHFLWVGDGPLAPGLSESIREKGLAGRVHMLGKRSDVPSLLKSADLFVLPSLFEGLPLIVLEAMASACPVVATRVCGTAETVLDGLTGRLVEPRNPESLAAGISEALSKPERSREWGRMGKTIFDREFTAARMARETAALYEELIRCSNRSEQSMSALTV